MKHNELENKSKEELIIIIEELKKKEKVFDGKMNNYRFGVNLESSRILKIVLKKFKLRIQCFPLDLLLIK